MVLEVYLPTLTQEKKFKSQEVFLNHFKTCGYIDQSAEVAGISRQTHYDWLDSDPDYVKAFELAKQSVLESFEQVCDQRAKEGIKIPITYKGEVKGHYRQPSDNLLMFRMKSMAPEKYRDNYQVTVEPGTGLKSLLESVRLNRLKISETTNTRQIEATQLLVEPSNVDIRHSHKDTFANLDTKEDDLTW